MHKHASIGLQVEMMDKLKERNRLLGRVTGELVLSDMEDKEIKLPDYLIRLDDFWKEFTKLLYTEGIQKNDRVCKNSCA